MSEESIAGLQARLAKVRENIQCYLDDGNLHEYSFEDQQIRRERYKTLCEQERELMYRIRRVTRGTRRRVVFRHY